jgi:hypothetical protein
MSDHLFIRVQMVLHALLLIGSCAGCVQPDVTTIVFHVPQGFEGTISLVLDPHKGVDIPIADHRADLFFPISGQLYVKQLDVFSTWHKELVLYPDGTVFYDQTRDFRNPAYQWLPGPTTDGAESVGKGVERGGTDFPGTTYRWTLTKHSR